MEFDDLKAEVLADGDMNAEIDGTGAHGMTNGILIDLIIPWISMWP